MKTNSYIFPSSFFCAAKEEQSVSQNIFRQILPGFTEWSRIITTRAKRGPRNLLTVFIHTQ